MEANIDASCGAFGAQGASGVVVQAAGAKFAEAATVGIAVVLQVVPSTIIGAGTSLHAGEIGLRGELIHALVRPALSGRTALGGSFGQGVAEIVFDLTLPGVLVHDV